ncbi:MAG: phytanoyl-CoA dioxygenase family protein [Candidatus Latescibacterota bacterium]|nr:phytanoyl-CoA dioxygenase family protein [Candidatus Latescibacterota bacterium]
MTAPVAAATLSPAEVETFHRQGHLGPFALCSEAEMAQMRPEIEAILDSEPPDHQAKRHNRHLEFRLVYELATHAEIQGRMASLCGRDLLLWRTNFFVKSPVTDEGIKDREVPWHQDFNYWPLEPPVIISAWIAVDPSTRENGCLQVISGSHRKVIPHVPADDRMLFREKGDPDYIDEDDHINVQMRPGEFILFNERTLHHSEVNRSRMRRIGLAVRVLPPIVRVLKWDSPRHGLVPICGEDPMGFNRLSEPPM